MKSKYLVFAVFAVLAIGCSKDKTATTVTSAPGACASSKILGTYVGNSNGATDTIKFNADCTGTDVYSTAAFNFTSIANTSGSTTIKVASIVNNDTQSLFNGTGDMGCDYTVSGTTLTFLCNGDSQGSYTKQ